MYADELLLPRSVDVPGDSLADIEDTAAQCLLQGRPLQALDYIQQAIDLRRGVNVDAIDSSCSAYIQASVKAVAAIAMSTLETGDLNLSLQMLVKLEDILKGCPLQSVSVERCAVLNNLACVYRKAGQLPIAKRHLSKALRLCEMFKDSPMDRAGTYLNMCAVLSNLGRHGPALEYGKKAVQFAQEKVISMKSLDSDEESRHAVKVLAVAYFNVGAEYEHLTAYTTALDWYRKAINVIENSDIPALKDMMGVLNSACKSMRRKAMDNTKSPASSTRSRPSSAKQASRLPSARPASASRAAKVTHKEPKSKRRPSSSKRTVPMPPLSATGRVSRPPVSVTPQPSGEDVISTKSGKRLMTCIQWAESEPAASGSDLDSLSKMGVMDFPEDVKPKRMIRVRGNRRRPVSGRPDTMREEEPIPGLTTEDWKVEDSSPPETDLDPVTTVPNPPIPKEDISEIEAISPDFTPPSLPVAPPIPDPPDLPVSHPTLTTEFSPVLLHQAATKLQAHIKGRVARHQAKMLLVASHRRSKRKLIKRFGKRFSNDTYGVISVYELPNSLLFWLGNDNNSECEITKPDNYDLENMLQSIDFNGTKLYFPVEIESFTVPKETISPYLAQRVTKVQALFRGNIARRLFRLNQAKLTKDAIRKQVYRAGKQLNSAAFGVITIYRLGPDLVEIVVEALSSGKEYTLEVPYDESDYEVLASRVKFNGAAVALAKKQESDPIIETPRIPIVRPQISASVQAEIPTIEPENIPIVPIKPKPVTRSMSPTSDLDQSGTGKNVIILAHEEKTLLEYQYLVTVSFNRSMRDFEVEAEAISLNAPVLKPVRVDEATIQQDFGLSMSMDLQGVAEAILANCSVSKFRLQVNS